MGWYFVGVDVGQCHDHTAIAVIERVEVLGAWDAVAYGRPKEVVLRLRFLERVALGLSYPQMVARVGQVTRNGTLAKQCHVMVDATGVGRPVVDLLRNGGLGCRLLPVVVTGGDAENHSDGYYKVPKRDLIVGLQVLLQRGALQIAAGMEHAPTLVKELMDMRVKVTAQGHEQYGAWREGEHDDLVFAVALACWGARKICP